MKKSVTKTILTFGIVMSIFMFNSASASAVVCSKAPDEVHHFTKCQHESEGFTRDGGVHAYLYGYDVNGEEIYRSCYITYHYVYCNYVCKYCDTMQGGSRHTDLVETTHSVNH